MGTIDRFLEEYERNSNSDDLAGIVSQFAETFLAAGPDGALAVRASDFALAQPKRKPHFDRAGLKLTALISKNTTCLYDRYLVFSTQWRFEFAPADKANAEFRVGSTFIVDTGGKQPKILAYIAHQDICKLLNERGML